MILLVYGTREILPFEQLKRHVSDFVNIIRCDFPSQIHEVLADSRENVSALLVQRGMPDSSVMIGECMETSPRIPVIISDGDNLKRLDNLEYALP